MSDREHFIATLQACYFGDRNAFDEIVRIYDKKENIIKEVREYIQDRYDGEVLTHTFDKDNVKELLEIVTDKKAKDKLLEILDKVDKEK